MISMTRLHLLFASEFIVGFECTKVSFKITNERQQQIQQIHRPMTKKGMQSLLGTTVICSKFIPNYSVRVQALYSMTANDYDWKACWTPFEIAVFDDLKQAVLDYCALHYPDTTKFLILKLLAGIISYISLSNTTVLPLPDHSSSTTIIKTFKPPSFRLYP